MPSSPIASTIEFEPGGKLVDLPAIAAEVSVTSDEDLKSLLRRRLCFLCPGVALMYLIGVAFIVADSGLSYIVSGDWQTWTVITLVLLPGMSSILVWSPMPLSLRQLRTIELVLVVLLAGRIAIRGYLAFWNPVPQEQFALWRATGDPEVLANQLNDSANFLCFTAATFIVAYGVCIPNTWRRCVLVVGTLACIPCVFWVAGVIDNELENIWYRPLWLSGFTQLAFSVALAVYGSHRVEVLRHRALQARRLGQYALRRRLGGGGMGEVYLADHVLLSRPCAIKVIHPQRAADQSMLQRFEREARATATLTHPNAIQVFDYGRTKDGTFYYVMEYLPGITLEELVRRFGPLPPARAVHLLQQICGALAEAHSIGLIHRDLKPGNVMLCQRGGIHDIAKLLDFGLVQDQTTWEADDRLTQQGTVIGTPAFLSPEQAGSGEAVDGRSDLYSLGALAYFLLVGQPPFGSRSAMKMIAAHLYEQPVGLRRQNPQVSPQLESIVLRCLAKQPSERFPDARSLLIALHDCQCEPPWTEEEAANWWGEWTRGGTG
jgi:serine/threonine-protein kinase